MNEERWNEVDQYLNNNLVPEDDVLAATLAAMQAAGLPQIQVAPNQGRLLTILARSRGARRILEIGTLGAYSSICLARGLAQGGKLITLEADPTHAQVAEKNVARAGLAETIEIRLGLAENSLERLVKENESPFDLVFIDADKINTWPYFQWALKLTRPGSLIVVDNVIRNGQLVDAGSQDASVRGMRLFVEKLKGETRVTATGIQTVGTKGYDGFVLAIVNH